MKKFIRLDMKGHWRGAEHKSSMNGLAGEWDEETGRDSWEEGISCYELDDKADALAELVEYWDEVASLHEIEDYKDMQVTIFEGEYIGEGSDYEDIATCEKTILETDATDIMKPILEAKDELEFGEIDEEEYHEILEKIELGVE